MILIVIIIAGFIYYKHSQSVTAAEKANSYTVAKQNLSNILTLSGQLDADEKAALKFQSSGRLAWVGVKEGDTVKKYQTIASLDQRDVQNRLTKYLKAYLVDRNSFDSGLVDNVNQLNDLSQTVRDDAKRLLENNQYNLDSAVLDVQYQALSIEYTNLVTPIDGIVTHVDTPYPGVNITPAGAEFDIVNPKTIYFSATADQTDVINLHTGMTGDLSFDAYPNKTFTGTLYYISFTPKAGETGTVYEVRFRLDQDAMKLPLKMAMTADLSITLEQKNNVLSIPSAFLKNDSHGNYVTEKTGGKDIKVYVQSGEEINGSVIINSGLKSGDVIYD